MIPNQILIIVAFGMATLVCIPDESMAQEPPLGGFWEDSEDGTIRNPYVWLGFSPNDWLNTTQIMMPDYRFCWFNGYQFNSFLEIHAYSLVQEGLCGERGFAYVHGMAPGEFHTSGTVQFESPECPTSIMLCDFASPMPSVHEEVFCSATSIEAQKQIQVGLDKMNRRIVYSPKEAEDEQFVGTTKFRHALVRFTESTSPNQRNEIEKTGVRFLYYIPTNKYIVTGTESVLGLLQEVTAVEEVSSVPIEYKLDSLLISSASELSKSAQTEDLKMAKVLFFPGTSYGEARKILLSYGAKLEATRVDFDFRQTLNAITLPASCLLSLAREDCVFLITQVDQPIAPANVDAQDTSNVDEIHPGCINSYSLDGSGVSVGIWEAGSVRVTHEQIKGRAILENTGSIVHYDDHASHVAGTIAGSGTGNPLARGMAPNAKLICWNTGNILQKVDANAHRISVSNHSSWLSSPSGQFDGNTSGKEGAYESQSKYNARAQAWDQIVVDHDLIAVWAAGNGRRYLAVDAPEALKYYTIGPIAVAKNVITVGAIQDLLDEPPVPCENSMTDFSSWGPTDDGRIKPDVVANGYHLLSMGADADDDYYESSGTSMSTPVVTGIAACLVQQYRRHFAGHDPTAATMKSILIHTARDGGSALGPDYRFGWGLVDARAAADFIENHNRNGNQLVLNSYSDSTMEYPMTYVGAGPIKVTLVWTDPPCVPLTDLQEYETLNIVNDLDLYIFGPGGTYYPWTLDPIRPSLPARQEHENDRDNVEQVYIHSPVPGSYAVWVSGQVNLGHSQNFTLCVSGLSPTVTAPHAFVARIVSPASGVVISDQAEICFRVIDNHGTSRVTLKIDGVFIDDAKTSGIDGIFDFTPPQSDLRQVVMWNTADVCNGTHTIEITALSSEGTVNLFCFSRKWNFLQFELV